VNWFTQHDR